MIEGFSGLDVVVVGDVMLDSWLQGRARRLAQEAPVPVIGVQDVAEAPGGAANTAVNLAALGARVHLLGVVGDDPAGRTIRSRLLRYDVDGLIVARDRPTAVKRRLMASGQLIARYDEEDRSPISPAVERRLLARFARLAATADAVVACDYAAGVCTPAVRRALRAGRLLVVDAHELRPWREHRPTAVLPNYAEAVRLLDEPAGPEDRVAFLAARSARLLAATRAELVVTTLDGEGTLLHRRGRPPYRTYAVPAPEHMSTGAGDTFTAAFALGLAAGLSPPEATDVAQAAAAVVVRRPGTAACHHTELARALDRTGGVQSPAEVVRAVAERRRRGERVVFTNGCFDVLHRGHVTCLEQARRLGDALVVGVNGDASVRRLKGPERPINPCEDRVAVLAGLACVDHVTVFDEDSPADLIRLIRPDVYVKGGDYHPDLLPEAALVRELGGEVHVLGYVPDRSTTAIVNRIRTRAQT